MLVRMTHMKHISKLKTKKLKSSEVLRYRLGTSQATARRHYAAWRKMQIPSLPERCDNSDCMFHTAPLIWNGKPLKPILDHVNGNNSDNRTKNLRLLCPNCDSQLPTRGGANKGRIEKSEGGFAIVSNGRRAYILPTEPEPGSFSLTGGKAEFITRSSDKKMDPTTQNPN